MILFTSHFILSVEMSQNRFSPRVETHQPPTVATPPSAAGGIKNKNFKFSGPLVLHRILLLLQLLNIVVAR